MAQADSQFVLRLADDHLILGQRLAEWCGHAPTLEEELSHANIGLDLLGQARNLFAYASQLLGGTDEDRLAFLRLEHEYKNVLLVEFPNEDFGYSVIRQLFFSAFMHPYWQALTSSADAELRAIAGQAVKEAAYHVRHSREWTLRLGDGTEESRQRVQTAVDDLWSFTGELFEVDDLYRQMMEAQVAPDPVSIAPTWRQTVVATLEEATLQVPTETWMQTGGRVGRHTEALGHLLTELQYMQRAYPDMAW